MKGYHDIGGQLSGRVDRREIIWDPWARQFEAVRSLLGDGVRRLVTLDELRRAYETFGKDKYYGLEFYERRLEAMLYVLEEKCVVSRAELESRIGNVRRQEPGRFSAGDRVRVLHLRKTGHIRTPWYIRGKVGTIDKYVGTFLNPEELGFGRTAGPAVNNYRVSFLQRDVWPDYEGNRRDKLVMELYQHWLELA